MWRKFFLPGILKIGVDVHAFFAKVNVPREAGLLHFGVRSTYILGLQIGTQFCPDMIYRSCLRRRYGAAEPSSSRIQD